MKDGGAGERWRHEVASGWRKAVFVTPARWVHSEGARLQAWDDCRPGRGVAVAARQSRRAPVREGQHLPRRWLGFARHGASIRQQMIDLTSSDACSTCHERLNSPGFAFIGFDREGRWRPESGAAENETQGWIPSQLMPDEPKFDGPEELARLLLEREETRRCFVRQWMQFALNPDELIRPEPAPEDVASVDVALRAFEEADLRLSSAIVAVARTNTFLR